MISMEKYLILKAAENGPASFEDNFGNDQTMFFLAHKLADDRCISLKSNEYGKFTFWLLPDGRDALEEREKSLKNEKIVKQTKRIAIATLVATIVGLIIQAKSVISAMLRLLRL